MQIKISGFVQVCELGLACQILYLAGMGRRREDGDTLAVYPNRGENGSFYVKKGSEYDKECSLLTVDEGYYNGALHRKGMSASVERELTPTADRKDGEPIFNGAEKANEDTEVGYTWPCYEYVDMCSLMRVLCAKLVPTATFKQSDAMGRGRRQRDMAEQYEEYLRIWSVENPEHKLKFI